MSMVALLALALLLGGDEELPFLDWGACPFECCVYTQWTATAEIPIRATRDELADTVFTIPKGETFTLGTV